MKINSENANKLFLWKEDYVGDYLVDWQTETNYSEGKISPNTTLLNIMMTGYLGPEPGRCPSCPPRTDCSRPDPSWSGPSAGCCPCPGGTSAWPGVLGGCPSTDPGQVAGGKWGWRGWWSGAPPGPGWEESCGCRCSGDPRGYYSGWTSSHPPPPSVPRQSPPGTCGWWGRCRHGSRCQQSTWK